jgi:hypothetical protein
VAPESTFPSVPFVFAYAAVDTDTSILAPLAWTLAVTALLALAAPLAAWLAGKIFLVGGELVNV